MGLILLKILKKGMVKVWLGSYIIQQAKIRYGCGFILLKMLKNGRLGFYIVENAKGRYC